MIQTSHDLTLVAASIVVSLVAAFTGLALTNNISRFSENHRKVLVVMSSFVLGGGIWSMHFVAMLAHKFPVPVYYDLLLTLGSVLVAILVVGVALLMLHFTNRTPQIILASGVVLGIGILSMHYIGMIGIRGAEPVFAPGATAMAVIVAPVMGIAAIMVAYGRRSKQNIVAGSLLMGLSVVSVHYTAMRGTHFIHVSEFVPQAAVLATDVLALMVTLAAFTICGAFLLVATTFLTNPSVYGGSANLKTPAEIDTAVSDQKSSLNTQSSNTQISAAPSPKVEAQKDASRASDHEVQSEVIRSIEIPYEQNKKIGYAMSDKVAAIRADGHYTQLYTELGVRFCPWSITEAEQRLQASGFHRTHRSYLVNAGSVVRFQKIKETGKCLLENIPQLSSVPVSRNRMIALMDVLDVGVHESG